MNETKFGALVRNFATERAIVRHVFHYVLDEMALGGYDDEYRDHLQQLHDGLMWRLEQMDSWAETGKFPPVSDAEGEGTIEQIFGSGYVECIQCGRWTPRWVTAWEQVPYTVIECEWCGMVTPFETDNIENV